MAVEHTAIHADHLQQLALRFRRRRKGSGFCQYGDEMGTESGVFICGIGNIDVPGVEDVFFGSDVVGDNVRSAVAGIMRSGIYDF